MVQCKTPLNVVVAEDDEDDRLLLDEAFREHCDCLNLKLTENGVELLEYLESANPRPSLVLLDLNMPRMSGQETLERMKADPHLKDIPVIIFTTSDEEDIIAKAYCKGASTFIRKPFDFEKLRHIAKIVSAYWCEIASLPQKDECPKRE